MLLISYFFQLVPLDILPASVAFHRWDHHQVFALKLLFLCRHDFGNLLVDGAPVRISAREHGVGLISVEETAVERLVSTQAPHLLFSFLGCLDLTR